MGIEGIAGSTIDAVQRGTLRVLAEMGDPKVPQGTLRYSVEQ